MNRRLTTFLCLLLLTLPVALLAEDKADTPDIADANDFTCRDILLASGEERDLAIMFLQGFFVGKSGKTTVDRNKLADATDHLLDLCIEDPDSKVLGTMEKALKKAFSAG